MLRLRWFQFWGPIAGRFPRAVYALGQTPDGNLVDECPLHPGEALRAGGTCATLNRKIEFGEKLRRLVRLALWTGEIRADSVDAGHDVIDRASAADAEQRFKDRYQRAWIEYGKREKAGTLPALKVKRGAAAAGAAFASLAGAAFVAALSVLLWSRKDARQRWLAAAGFAFDGDDRGWVGAGLAGH